MKLFAIFAVLGITLNSSANAEESHYFTLNKNAGRVKMALYGGLVENKIVSISDSEESDKKLCWYGSWNKKGYLGRELSGRYLERNTENFSGRIEVYQGPKNSPELNDLITQFLKIYSNTPEKMNVAIDSDKQTINLVILGQSEDTEISKLANEMILKLGQICKDSET